MTPVRVVFFGSPAFAVPSLRAVAAGTTLVAVVSQPDRPAGRGQAPSPPAVKVAATALGVPVIQPETLRTPEAEATLAAFGADLFVVVAYGRILPQRLLDLPRLGPWNVHASLLPRLRGAAPIQWSLIRGDSETGVVDHAHGGRPRHRAGGGDARAGDRRRRHGGDAVRQARRAGRRAARRDAARDRRRTRHADAAGARRRDAGADADQGGRPPALRSAGARRLRARARRRSVAGRERDAGRRAAEAVRAARRRRDGGDETAPAGRGAGPPARGAGGRLRRRRDRVRASCSCRDGGACRPRRCSPGTASRRARSSRDRPGRKPPPRASRRPGASRRRPPAPQGRSRAHGPFAGPGGARARRGRAARTPTARCRRRWIARPRSARRTGGWRPSWSTACCAGAARIDRALQRAGDQRARQAGPARADRAAGRRVPDPVPRSRAGLRGRRRRRRRVQADRGARRGGVRERAACAGSARQGEPPLPDAAVDPAGYLVAAAGLPAWLAELLLAELPAAEALAFAASIADPAPVTLRANTGRVTRDAAGGRARVGAGGRAAGAVGGRAGRARRAAAGRARLDPGLARGPVRDRRRRRADRGRAVRRGGGRAHPGRVRGQRRQDRAPAGARRRSRARRRDRHRRRQAGRRARDAAGAWG